MPKSEAPPSESIAFHVPVPLLQEAQELAELEGWTNAAFHRLCWEAGLSVQAEKSNKRLVNKGLRAKYKEKPSEVPEGLTIENLKTAVMEAQEQGEDGVVIGNLTIMTLDRTQQMLRVKVLESPDSEQS